MENVKDYMRNYINIDGLSAITEKTGRLSNAIRFIWHYAVMGMCDTDHELCGILNIPRENVLRDRTE